MDVIGVTEERGLPVAAQFRAPPQDVREIYHSHNGNAIESETMTTKSYNNVQTRNLSHTRRITQEKRKSTSRMSGGM
jgi:hypothetical protein